MTAARRPPRPAVPGGVVPDWSAQLYQAGARYERPGVVATRVEFGQIVSPIGQGILDWRPNLNPMIMPHIAYLIPMPAFDRANYVQAAQTLTAPWYAAARHEGASAPPLLNGVAPLVRTTLRTWEATAGWRIAPELTLRSSYYARRSYVAPRWDNQVGISLVWARRWR